MSAPPAATFAGKFGFQTTNAGGPVKFLTTQAGQGVFMPTLTAPQMTLTERAMLYATVDGNYVVAMLVPAATPGAYDTVYLADESALSLVVAVADEGGAQGIVIASLTASESDWAIIDTTTNAPVPLGYIPTLADPELVYASTGGQGMLTTLANSPVTPGYDTTIAAGSATNADFTYVDLSGLDYGGIDLSGSDFSNADLTGTSFAGATLTGATFDGVTLDDTVLTGATLTNASFAGANLTAAVWGTKPVNAAGASFDGAFMGGCAIGSLTEQGTMNGASFVGTDLSTADLTNVDLASAVLHGANLTGANLTLANLTQAELGASTGDAPATASYAILQNATFDQADLFAVDFSYATINGSETTLNEAATIQQANFANAYMEGISLRSSNLQGAILDGACLVGVDFTGAVLGAAPGTMAASLASACLQAANFTGATLDGTNLANAAISFAAGEIETRYCSALGMLPPWPRRDPLRYDAATTIDAAALTATTVCPNGLTYGAGSAAGLTLEQMLTAAGAPRAWLAMTCLGTRTPEDRSSS